MAASLGTNRSGSDKPLGGKVGLCLCDDSGEGFILTIVKTTMGKAVAPRFTASTTLAWGWLHQP